MIGWYVHHQGKGHLHRAQAVRAEMATAVAGLSSLARPEGWEGSWVQLDRDDNETPVDVTAGARLHWAPRHHPGLRSRMAAISSWIAACQPELIVSDVSVEVALLARLHGVPVVSVVLPGDRSDPAHRMGYDISALLVGVWPASATEMASGLDPEVRHRLVTVGGLSRFPVAADLPRRPGRRRVTVLGGGGGHSISADLVEKARRQAPEWAWQVLGPGGWTDDPWPSIRDADVVLTHAGQNAVAEVAAARRPAVIVPAERPHREQEATARALASGDWPVVVEPSWPRAGWGERLARAGRLDGEVWERWVDGGAAVRFARLLEATASAQTGTRT